MHKESAVERETPEFRHQFTVNGARAVIQATVLADFGTFAGATERTDRIMKSLAKADLIIVPKPRGDVEAVREAVRTGDWSAVSERDLMAWREAPIPEAEVEPKPIGKDPAEVLRQQEAERRRAEGLGVIDRNLKPSQAEPEDDEPESDTWGVCARLAGDMASVHGCRVELSGPDDPHLPLTYYDDLCTYAVVTDRATGRLVGLVECWESEDGDPIVPRNWLTVTLSAWTVQGTPKRAA